jgi:hypothetical protein
VKEKNIKNGRRDPKKDNQQKTKQKKNSKIIEKNEEAKESM